MGLRHEFVIEEDGWECRMNVSFYDPKVNLYRTGISIKPLPDGHRFGKPGYASIEFLEDDFAVESSLRDTLKIMKLQYADFIKLQMLE